VCGIAGIWQLDGQKIQYPTIERFIGALAHRGPDGQSVLIDDEGCLALAHRRLAILDLSEAAVQPMRSMSGRYEIIHNGEIYNFLELRADLEQNGFRFRTATDTEVILAAYERWGPECLLRFNGMWSFAIWDRLRRSLFVARDRFGVKPLYVLVSGRWFAFASELKAFLRLDGFNPTANPKALKARLAENFSEHILLRDIESVPPGYYLEVSSEGTRATRWWNTLDHLVAVPCHLTDQAEEFRELLLDACRLRLRSDVPLATSLSGGLDSSSVLCSRMMARERRQPETPDCQRAFIASFPGTSQDETEHALLAAKRAQAIPVIQSLSAEAFRADIDAYLYQFEEIGGLFGAGAWMLYREMRRQGIAVSMDGLGGDEALGGYTGQIMLALIRNGGLACSPRRTLDLVNTLYYMQTAKQLERVRSRALLAALTMPTFRSVFRHHPLARYLMNVEQRELDHVNEEANRSEQEAIDALGPLTGALYRGFHHYLLPRVLRNFDAHSMGHGIEVRLPFLDWRVVCYAFSVPESSKVGNGYSKRLLREAMRGILPEAIRLRRHKIGYNVPVSHWLAGGLRDWLWDAVNEREFLRNELWNGKALLALARAKRESHTAWTPSEAHTILVAVSAHWWQTRWLRSASW
jgi:asparagine synthase (glutamine-hydrolysing)